MTKQINTDDGVWYYAFKKPNWRAISQLDALQREVNEKKGFTGDKGEKAPPLPTEDVLKIFHPFFRVGRAEHELTAKDFDWWQDADYDFTEKVFEDFMLEFEKQIKAKNPMSPPSE